MPVVGVVPYLNAVPLVAALPPGVRVRAEVPSRLGDLLVAGDVDAALLPVAEAARGVGDGFLGRFGIAGEGPVESVLLFLRKPLAAVRTVRLDPASRTSVALARHLLAQAGAGDAEAVRAPAAGPDPREGDEDAVLVIGDPALDRAATWDGDVLDLGAAWTEATGLPFVFARWTARPGLAAGERQALAAALDEAAEAGLPRRGAHARAWARARGRDEEAAEAYVTRAIRYRIGPREEEALARFTAIVRAQDAGDRAPDEEETRHA